MTSAEIEAFLKLYETGNMTQAASELFITQSSLSIKIKRLEDELGTTLFHRGKGRRELSPTYQGEKFYRLALKYRAIEDQMHSMLDDMYQEKLRITIPNSIGTYIMTAVFEQFMEQYPDVFLEIRDLGSESSAVHQEVDDMDLSFTPDHIKSYGMVKYGELIEPMVFVCDHRSDYPEIIHGYDLKPEYEIYIDWTPDFDTWHQRQFGWTPRISLSIMAHLEHFLKHPGRWAIVPVSVANHISQDGTIIEKDMAFEVPNRKTDCVYHSSTRKEALINAFLDCLKKSLAENEDQRIKFQ